MYAQRDSLVLKNGDVIVGEIKSLNNGVLTIETDYSKSDFTLKWVELKALYSKTSFLITLQNGQRVDGAIQSTGEGTNVVILSPTGVKTETTLGNIVYLKGVKSKIWSRIYGNIDLGLSLTKANNLRQFNVQSGFGYTGRKWDGQFQYSDIRSKQDSVAQTKRTETGITLKYYLPKDWFLITSITFLSNTEQALKLRTTASIGAGNFLVHTNRSYWALAGGLSFNNETFSNGTEKRKSLEAFAGSELSLFDIGDLNLSNDIYVYRSITESDRWRTDFSLDSKYDLPLNLYLKMGLTFNYDNRPAIKGNEFDYVFTFGIGWEFNK